MSCSRVLNQPRPKPTVRPLRGRRVLGAPIRGFRCAQPPSTFVDRFAVSPRGYFVGFVSVHCRGANAGELRSSGYRRRGLPVSGFGLDQQTHLDRFGGNLDPRDPSFDYGADALNVGFELSQGRPGGLTTHAAQVLGLTAPSNRPARPRLLPGKMANSRHHTPRKPRTQPAGPAATGPPREPGSISQGQTAATVGELSKNGLRRVDCLFLKRGCGAVRQPTEGFEPSTPALRKLCSTTELRRQRPRFY